MGFLCGECNCVTSWRDKGACECLLVDVLWTILCEEWLGYVRCVLAMGCVFVWTGWVQECCGCIRVLGG